MKDADEARKSRHIEEVDSESEFLEADREVTRQELEETVEALARRADVPARTQEARVRATARTRKLVRRGIRHLFALKPMRAAVLAGGVVIVYVIVRARPGKR